MRVLVACECSGMVREAFNLLGHDAWSCDIKPPEHEMKNRNKHFQCDVRSDLIWEKPWDLMIAHPDCTHLSVSGSQHWGSKQADGRQQKAIEFVQWLWNRPLSKVRRIAIENPVGILPTVWRPADQYVEPWWFGDGYTKHTGLWLRLLPKLVPDSVVDGRYPATHLEPPGPDQATNRSRTYPGFARAMAEQWGDLDGA